MKKLLTSKGLLMDERMHITGTETNKMKKEEDVSWKGPMIESLLRKAVQYGTEEYSTPQYSTVQYSTGQYSTVQYSTVQYSTLQYSTVQYTTVQYRTGK